jgi:hypothetical protein
MCNLYNLHVTFYNLVSNGHFKLLKRVITQLNSGCSIVTIPQGEFDSNATALHGPPFEKSMLPDAVSEMQL